MKRYSLIVFIAVLLCGAIFAGESSKPLTPGQWTAERAWAWYHRHPWLVGCNFLPSTAVNDVEMWQKSTFDPKTIDRELGWARQIGFNTVRVFVNYAVWESEAADLKDTFRRFLKIADKHDISTLVILFDDCFKPEPRVGKQDEPEPGVHNSQWVQSPGVKRRGNLSAWPKLEAYVKDMVGTFRSDKRVLAWELYNEPAQSLPLVEAAFRWAREARPSQPVTTTIFGNAEMQKRIMELSDVICFHNYGPLTGLKAESGRLAALGRPVLCTEWMARPSSRFETHLAFFKEKKIACWNWGLVAGRTQTYFPWGSPKGAPEPKVWFHDIFRADGRPHNPREVQYIQVMTGKLPADALPSRPKRTVLAATAEQSPVPWRYTLEKPEEGWFKADFDDRTWKQGAAPFGREEAPIARKPNTVWTSPDIWLRREFEMPPGHFSEVGLSMHHDEDTEVFINGVLALKAAGYNAAYEPFEISAAARAAVKPGRNILAVHTHQTVGGQYIDLGVDGVLPEAGKAITEASNYRGWNTLVLKNGLVELQVLPEIGGRIAQFKLGEKEFFWVNPQVAGELPPSNGLAADGGWFNVGGDKLWPAPQGWDNERQWPGPPDAVLDGQPYTLEKLRPRRGETAIRLTSGKDPRSGIQFSRVVRLYEGSTHVSFEATMKNIDKKPRRWGIWAHTQLDATKPDGSTYNFLMQAWCPLNPQSKFPKGYEVIFGEKNNPAFMADSQRGLMHVQYQYKVGKIGLDSHAGWVATVDGETGAVFVQRFVYEPKKDYPDGSSVEFWHNGAGQIHAYNKEIVMSTNPAENPYVFESEILSPYAELKPGRSYTWNYDWYACNIGGNYPVVHCTELGVVAEPLTITARGDELEVRGRFGVFAPGYLEVTVLDVRGRELSRERLPETVAPLTGAVIKETMKVPASAGGIRVLLMGADGRRELGELARSTFRTVRR